MQEFATRVEARFRFSKKEVLWLFITSLIASFVLTFRKWGGETFNLEEGLVNFVIACILVFIFLFIHFSVQKLVALKLGYVSHYKVWINGLLISLIICFFSYGYIPLFFTGSLLHDVIPKLRAGVFRGGVKHKDLGVIAFAGPLSNIILAGLFAPLYLATKSSFFYAVILINLLMAIFSLLPIPTFEKLRQFAGGTTGLYLFIASRWVFVLVFATVIGYAALILWFKIFSYVIALLIGGLITIVYYSQFEIKS
ncbi:hypothetical protein JW756_01570 [Candidatus Woesearchaeota archaeon]|nr:hypothetical protein [Candidatus Woesearchaeota archaeon]